MSLPQIEECQVFRIHLWSSGPTPRLTLPCIYVNTHMIYMYVYMYYQGPSVTLFSHFGVTACVVFVLVVVVRFQRSLWFWNLDTYHDQSNS